MKRSPCIYCDYNGSRKTDVCKGCKQLERYRVSIGTTINWRWISDPLIKSSLQEIRWKLR